jgi:hypothetical protein
MKKNKYISKILLVAFLAIGLFSCTNGFEEMNQNPNNFDDATPESLFTGAVISTLDLVGGEMNDQMYNNYASYYGGKGGQFPKFFFTDSGVNQYWRRFYINILTNTQKIIDTYSDDPKYANRVHIAKIWKSYVYSILVSTFGPVPYVDTLGSRITTTYASEEVIYTAILDMLKAAGDGIDVSATGDKLSSDPVFNGNNLMWKKFANTLRLKIALRIAGGFSALAEKHGKEVMANEAGLISSNAENIAMKWETNQQNWSFNYARYVYLDAADDVVPFVNFHYILNMKTYRDPRLKVIVEPSTDPITIRDTIVKSSTDLSRLIVTYPVAYFGRPTGGLVTPANWDMNADRNILNGLSNNRYCRPSKALFMAADMKYYIVTYAELNFMCAEAKLNGWGGNKTAEQYYYAGIDASFEQYGVSGAITTKGDLNLTAYKAQDGVRWSGPDSVDFDGDRDLFGAVTSYISTNPMDKIVRQLWLTSYNQGHDIWCLQKRTRLLPLIPNFSTDTSLGLVFADMPERMVYPSSEIGINNAGYRAAIQFLGGNELNTPLKMNKSYTPVDWNNLKNLKYRDNVGKTNDIKFNIEFALFYGISQKEFIDRGLVEGKGKDYEIIGTLPPALP